MQEDGGIFQDTYRDPSFPVARPSLFYIPKFLVISYSIYNTSKYKANLAKSFPVISQCLKYFKHLLISPFVLYIVALEKKNYN